MTERSEKSLKIFICNHPGELSLYSNLAKKIKKYAPDVNCLLIKINHPYFKEFNFSIYEKSFDRIFELKFIDYRINLLLGFWDAVLFRQKVKRRLFQLLVEFCRIDIFVSDSAWFPVNLLQSMLVGRRNVRTIVKFCGDSFVTPSTKTDWKKNLIYKLYSRIFRCYTVSSIISPNGVFLDYKYESVIPGKRINVVDAYEYNSFSESNDFITLLPFPGEVNRNSDIKKDMVIFFGDASIFPHYKEYLPSYEVYLERLKSLFNKLEDEYGGCQLYYKPHPIDKGEIMPGVDLNVFKLFGDEYGANELFDAYGERIRAVYSFASTCSTIGARYGIPAYRVYRYVFDTVPDFIKKYKYSEEKERNVPPIHDISNLEDIGKIDNVKITVREIDLDGLWKPVLNISEEGK